MKNLKKFLAVLLAVALAFGVMATAAANTDMLEDLYPDDFEDIEQTEAVEVLTNIGVFEGFDTGLFDPTGSFTREQGAKVIAYLMVGSAAARALTTSTSSFNDVAADRWSAKYIEYAVSNGIINGYGDGTFGPTDPLTGSQFAKMLLMALGYGQNGEYVGPNWEVNVIADATSIGILVGNTIDFTAVATREQIALFALNALTSPYVVYDSRMGAYDAEAAAIWAGRVDMATNVFGIVKNLRTIDGVDYDVWVDNFTGNDISTLYVADSPIHTYTDGSTLASKTTPGNAKFVARIVDPATVYENGVDITGVNNAASIAALTGGAIDKGDIVNLFDNNGNGVIDKVTVIKKTVDRLISDPLVDAATGKVTITGDTTGVIGAAAQDPEDVPGYELLSAGDVVLWYQDGTGVYQIEALEPMAGTMSGFTTGVNATINGAVYEASQLTGAEAIGTLIGQYNIPSVSYYLDDGGYVVRSIAPTPGNPADAWVYVPIAPVTVGFDDLAQVIFSDGTKSVVTYVDGAGTTVAATGFYTYTKDANDLYTLTTATNEVLTGAAVALNAAPTVVGTNSVAFDNTAFIFDSGTVNFFHAAGPVATTLKGDANTVFLLDDGTTIDVVKGINNLPATLTTAAVAAQVVAVYDVAAGPAMDRTIMVYVDVAASSSAGGDWVFVYNQAGFSQADLGGGVTLYTYQAVINGTVNQTISTTNNALFGADGLYRVSDYDANGYATVRTAYTGAGDVAGVASTRTALGNNSVTIAGGVITIPTTGARSLAGDVKYYLVQNGATPIVANEVASANIIAANATSAGADSVYLVYQPGTAVVQSVYYFDAV